MEKNSGTKVYTPDAVPALPADAKPPPPLEGEHEEMRLKVLSHFSDDDYKLPEVEENPSLMEEEKFWLTNDCILRYLRASKWDLATAIKRLESTLKWRREFGFYDKITWEHIEPEGMTGKEVIYGNDYGRRPNLYMFPSRQNTEESIRQVHYATFMLERTLDLTGPGIETVALFINYGDKSAAKGPSLSMSRNVLNILQTHYPERLGRVYVINIPFLLNAFFKIIMPVVDPVTREKVKFNPKVIEEGYVDADKLVSMSRWGGKVDFEYEHGKYWPALKELCTKRREEQFARWKTLGGRVGLDEWRIKGGPEVSEPAPEAAEKTTEAAPST